jgi:acyl carrier protein
MLPQYYIEMKALPITSNGKLDKKALPSPKSNIEKKSITLPRTDTEREMVKLFIKVLNVENVDIDDSFYSLGGHSLKMTRLLNEIEKKFGKRLSLRNVMEAKTVRRISYLIDNEDEQKVKKMSGLSVAKPIN